MTTAEVFDDALDNRLLGLVVGGALALAHHHFPRQDQTGRPTVAIADAHFLLSGQMEAWAAWPQMPEREQLRVARLLRDRPVQLANRNAFAAAVQQLLAVGGLPGFRPTANDHLVLAELGVAAQAYADENLAALAARRWLAAERPVRWANSGEYVTELRCLQRRAVDARGRCTVSTRAGHPTAASRAARHRRASRARCGCSNSG